MTEQGKELLSILMDDEASEIEVHRLLRAMPDDVHFKQTWVRYQETRRVIRRQTPKSAVTLGPDQHLDLFQRISLAIDADEAYAESGAARSRPLSSWYKPMAVAASLVVAIFAGQAVYFNLTPDQVDVATQSQVVSPQASITPQLVTSSNSDEAVNDDLELKELDDERQQQLRAYLNQHGQMARMKQQQLVTYPTPATKK